MNGKSVQDWLAEGAQLHEGALREYQDLERQIEELEHKLVAKRDEVNQIAQVIGKELVEGNRRLTAEIVDRGQPGNVPNNPNTIARALTGRAFGR